ncbi:MAG: hypothetical protein JOZ30_16030 [Hyphomicrobiales bacterium]|nr:hypothetical protein [Hyphomicrobiales bacterium]MBV9741146.1 hypothetical protein [Hyphomicrobiales bacterium]
MKSKYKLGLAGALAGAATLGGVSSGLPHAIVGDRIFPVTLAIDDPGVADELSLPTFARFTNADGSIETDISFEYDKLITKDFALSIADTWTHVHPGGDGFQNLQLGAKYHLYSNEPHEFMLSVGVNVGVGGTGAARVGAANFSTITPAVFFGKGFGDLPDSLMWLRPAAITGAIGVGFPDPWKKSVIGIDTTSCDVTMTSSGICGFDVNTTHHPVFLNWGLTFQYSLPYLNAHVRQIDGPEFLRSLTPIVEAAFQSPVANFAGTGAKTTGTINPGIIYSADTYQITVEAMVPVNKASGKHVGVIAQLHFFLDDIFPNSLGKPLFSEH